MKKKIILRCLIGAPIGLSISFIITLIISAMINKGEFYPVASTPIATEQNSSHVWRKVKPTTAATTATPRPLKSM